MSGRQRRVGASVLAGAVLAVCGCWAGRFGYGAAGLVLSSSAVLVVLAGAWRAGALSLPRPSSPSRGTAPRRRLSARERADGERSARLLKAIAALAVAAGEPGGPG
ncbi:hypothetical protein ACFXB4_35840 [Streptomyces lavendulae]|uniref:hypothetical protein n=1 Tax=Streptomyces lavendulae TaxID=1914 RepID=UPI003681CDF6